MKLSRLRVLAFLLLAVGLATTACVNALDLVKGEPLRLFDLTPKSTFDDSLPKVEARITIDVPSAATGLNTAKIAVKPTPTQFEYYARAQWVDVVPVMTQTLLLESFDNSEKIKVLGRGAYGLRADYGLLINIREFQAEYEGDGPPDVRVHLQFRLVEMPRRKTIASSSVIGLTKADGRKMTDIITAFDEAFGRAAKDLVAWTLRRVNEHGRSS